MPLALLNVGPLEMVVLGVLALLLFGGDLPEVARTWGKHLAELRRHMNGLRDELNAAMYAEPDRPARLSYQAPEYAGTSAPTSAAAAPPQESTVEHPDPDASRAAEPDLLDATTAT
jgi:sec-independent protein translocase protein TatA